jgi:hypothetical protein
LAIALDPDVTRVAITATVKVPATDAANATAQTATVQRTGRDWTVREVPLADIVKAVVQVEFSPPSQAELELATRNQAGGTEAGS